MANTNSLFPLVLTAIIIWFTCFREGEGRSSPPRPWNAPAAALTLSQNHSVNIIGRSSRHKRGEFGRPPETLGFGGQPDKIATYELVRDRFFVYKKELTWDEAYCTCSCDGKCLATILKETDARKVIDALFNAGEKDSDLRRNRSYWTGLNDKGREGTWEWTCGRGQLTYDKFWQKHQPDHVPAPWNNNNNGRTNGRPQHCGTLSSPCWNLTTSEKLYTHRFDDLECETKMYFICDDLYATPTDPSCTCPKSKDKGNSGREMLQIQAGVGLSFGSGSQRNKKKPSSMLIAQGSAQASIGKGVQPEFADFDTEPDPPPAAAAPK